MTIPITDSSLRGAGEGARHATSALAAAVLGFFVVTLDAVIVNVTLPSIRADLGGGVSGLQWLVDGYTLMFAALLLTAGSLTDQVGARRAFGGGMTLFVLASAACGFAPAAGFLVSARFVQGVAAAVLMPSSMALIRQAFPEPVARGRAVAVWAMGGAVASSAGPVLGGALNLLDWRWVFFVNLPVGVVALVLLARVAPSPRRPVPFDYAGQAAGIVAMGGLTYGAIEAGSAGLASSRVLVAFAVAVLGLVLFVLVQKRAAHPMVPPALFRSRTVVITVVTGFAFMVGYYGLPFVLSLYLQQNRGLSALATGVAFLPMMLIGAALTPCSARLAERLGRRSLIVAGLGVMTVGLVALGVLPASAPVWLLSVLIVLVGLGGPLVAPPATALLLDAVPGLLTGVASGVFNTSRQLGGALAVAVFGALLANPATLTGGVHASLLLAAAVLMLTTVAALRLRPESVKESR